MMAGERQGLFELMMTLPERESCPALSRVLEIGSDLLSDRSSLWPHGDALHPLEARSGQAQRVPPGASTLQAGLVGSPCPPCPSQGTDPTG